MTDDDRPIGSVLTRREALALLGVGGLTAMVPGAAAAPAGRDGHLRGAARADRGAVLRGREAPPLGHPLRSGRRQRAARRAAPAGAARLAPHPRRLRAAARRHGGSLALRRARRLLGRPGSGRRHARQEVPARLPDDRRRRARALHHDLPGRVPRAAPCTSTSRSASAAAGGPSARLHLAALLRRRAQRPGLRPAAVRGADRAAPAQRAGRYLPQRGRPALAHGDARGARLRGHVRSGARGSRDALPDHAGRPGAPPSSSWRPAGTGTRIPA